MLKQGVTLIVLASFTPLSANSFILGPKSLKTEITGQAIPSLDKIETGLMMAKYQQEIFQSIFTPSAYAKAFRSETKEKQLSSIAPITSPINQIELGVKKATTYGTTYTLKNIYTQSSNSFLKKSTSEVLQLDMSFDLYKDFLGRSSRRKVEALELNRRKANYEKEVNKAVFYNGLKRLYWTIVANNEAMKLVKGLIKTSQKQVKLAQLRAKNKVADRGEVARYQSQSITRQGQLVSLQYQREELLKSLKELIPSLADKEIILGKYNVGQAVNSVLACAGKIKSYPSIPYDNTVYDDMVNLNTKALQNEMAIDKYIGAPEIAFVGSVGLIGKGLGTSKAYDDLTEESANQYSVGLNINIPFGQNNSSLRATKKRINLLRKNSYEKETGAKLGPYHTQLVKSITLLQEIVKNNKLNTNYLKVSLDYSKKKYSQARITAQQLILDQDAYLNSGLEEIQSKLTVLNTIFDYLNVFTKTPCDFNRI